MLPLPRPLLVPCCFAFKARLLAWAVWLCDLCSSRKLPRQPTHSVSAEASAAPAAATAQLPRRSLPALPRPSCGDWLPLLLRDWRLATAWPQSSSTMRLWRTRAHTLQVGVLQRLTNKCLQVMCIVRSVLCSRASLQQMNRPCRSGCRSISPCLTLASRKSLPCSIRPHDHRLCHNLLCAQRCGHWRIAGRVLLRE